VEAREEWVRRMWRRRKGDDGKRRGD